MILDLERFNNMDCMYKYIQKREAQIFNALCDDDELGYEIEDGHDVKDIVIDTLKEYGLIK